MGGRKADKVVAAVVLGWVTAVEVVAAVGVRVGESGRGAGGSGGESG